jgi:cation diffusion facilitator CzcD-associated flavoprotein CzcO
MPELGSRRVTVAALVAAWVAARVWRYVATLREQAAARERATAARARGFRVCIVGGGMSGIAQAVALARAGIPYEILEQSSDFGGTWMNNTYPDAACDVPSHFYSYSFAHKWDWERVWAKQPAILAYFRHVATAHGLREHTRFGVRVVSATFDPELQQWEVRTVPVVSEAAQARHALKQGATPAAVSTQLYSLLITAVGQLDRPKWPALPGLERFEGARFHTAEWDHAVALAGKRVVGVGTGPSAVQAFPAIAQSVAHLTVAQRSPVWVTDKADYLYPRLVRWLLLHVPGLYWAKRCALLVQFDAIYYLLFPSRSRAINKLVQEDRKRWMLEQLGNKRDLLGPKLIPRYNIGCKRLAISSDWLPMMCRDNVTLQTAPIAEVLPHAVRFADGSEQPCDVLICATGFETTAFLADIDIAVVTGPAGSPQQRSRTTLQQLWGTTPRAYRAVAVAGVPNLFTLYGPGSNLGHSSIIFMVERQVEYTTRTVCRMLDAGIGAVEVKAHEYQRYADDLQRRLRDTVFNDGTCTSWYKNQDGIVINNWYGSCVAYSHQMQADDMHCYTQTPLCKDRPRL